jgi:hypothetical protein
VIAYEPVGVAAEVVSVSVADPPVACCGEKAAVVPLGTPLADRATVAPVALPVRVRVRVCTEACAGATVAEVGLAATPRAPGVCWTTRDTDDVWTRVPDRPVMVSGYVPTGVDRPTARTRALVCVLPELIDTELGLGAPVVPVGRPVTLRATVPVKP